MRHEQLNFGSVRTVGRALNKNIPLFAKSFDKIDLGKFCVRDSSGYTLRGTNKVFERIARPEGTRPNKKN